MNTSAALEVGGDLSGELGGWHARGGEHGMRAASPQSTNMIAADIMTDNPRTIRSTDPVSDAVDLLHSMNVRHLPVVDGRGQLIGMLSDRDLGPLMRTLVEGAEVEHMVVPLSERAVADFMTGGVVSVGVEADVSEVIELMLSERIGAIPVVDEADNVCGIISYVDILRVLGAPKELERRTSVRT